MACRTLCCLDILLYSWGQHCHLYHHHHHHPHHQWWSTIAILTISVNLLLRLRTFGQYTGSANKEKEGENPKQTISFHQNTFFEQCSNQTFIHLKVRSNTQFKHIWIQNISLFVPTTHRFSCWNWFLGLFLGASKIPGFLYLCFKRFLQTIVFFSLGLTWPAMKNKETRIVLNWDYFCWDELLRKLFVFFLHTDLQHRQYGIRAGPALQHWFLRNLKWVCF